MRTRYTTAVKKKTRDEVAKRRGDRMGRTKCVGNVVSEIWYI